MSLFNKIKSGANTLFNKAKSTPNLFRKIDNSIARVGSFVRDTANQLGVPQIANLASSIVNNTHAIRNNLEKAINSPVKELRNNYA